MRRLPRLPLFVPCAILFLAAAARDDGSGARGGVLGIPFEEDDGHIFLQVRVNGSDPLWFGLDTGAIRSVIDEGCARRLGLRQEGSQSVGGAGGVEEAATLKDVTFGLKGTELRDQTAWGMPLGGVSAALGRELSGILGRELFERFVVVVDYTRKRIDLLEPGGYAYRGSGESLPLEMHDGEAYVRAQVVLPGRDPIEGEFVIDTGGNNPLALAAPFVERHQILEAAGRTFAAHGGGVGGEMELSVGRMKGFRLGRFLIEDPITAFIHKGSIAAPGKAGNIGGRLLRRFTVVFDYSRRRMILEPGGHFSEPDAFEMLGAAVVTDGPPFHTFRIVKVRDGSSAAAAGLQAHDVIAAVDGRSSADLTLFELRRLFRREGREYVLRIRRGDESRDVKVRMTRVL